MIELPESYVLSSQIGETLTGKTVLNATANSSPHKFAWYTGDPAEYQERLSGKRITAVVPGGQQTCGGNVEIYCEDMLVVLSTPVRYHPLGEPLPKKHQLWLEFTDFSSLTCTVQMWGSMFCMPVNNKSFPDGYVINPSPSPLSDEFSEEYFHKLLSEVKETLSAKAFLATEQRFPGLGNGVLQDILFEAKIHPKTKLQALTAVEKQTLFRAVKDVLFRMTIAGGRDTERDLFGCPGGYKTVLSTKTAGNPCPVCGGNIVREAYLGGNIYFCPTCQPWKK